MRATDLLLLVRILVLVLRAEEEVDGGRLDLGVGMVASKSDDCDCLCVVPEDGEGVTLEGNPNRALEEAAKHAPDSLPPELLDEDDSPHGLAAGHVASVLLALALDLRADDLYAHPSLDHDEEESLNHAVKLVILGLHVGRADVGQDGLANGRAKSGGGEDGQKRKECFEETGTEGDRNVSRGS